MPRSIRIAVFFVAAYRNGQMRAELDARPPRHHETAARRDCKSHRPPEFTVCCRSSERIWFLLPHGPFHRSGLAQASAARSTGVWPLRGTPGERGEIDGRVQVTVEHYRA